MIYVQIILVMLLAVVVAPAVAIALGVLKVIEIRDRILAPRFNRQAAKVMAKKRKQLGY